MSKPTVPDLIRQVAVYALASARTLLPEWLPDGAIHGTEWVARNATRGDREAGSFGVSLDTGRWNDFADSSARGGDLVSLLAYLRECRQVEAAQEIDQRLALGLFGTPVPDSPERQAQRQAVVDAAQALADRNQFEREQAQQEAALRAAELWRHGRHPERRHLYLDAKRVLPYGLRQANGGRLLVPLVCAGKLVNVQTIDGRGRKRFLQGGRVKGCYCPIGGITPGCRVYLCEGWATGATIHQHTGLPVVCAMNAGNLGPVAKSLREQYGTTVELVIAGDDDRETSGNPGRTAANSAALEYGALVVFPEWPTDAPLSLTDFNDLHLWQTQHNREART